MLATFYKCLEKVSTMGYACCTKIRKQIIDHRGTQFNRLHHSLLHWILVIGLIVKTMTESNTISSILQKSR